MFPQRYTLIAIIKTIIAIYTDSKLRINATYVVVYPIICFTFASTKK